MERWVRVQNERDRQVLAWLRGQVGDAAIIAAAQSCAGPGIKPYLSAVCRALHVTPPRYAVIRTGAGEVGERHLVSIYQILRGPRSAGHAAQ
ncbi:hypothetical protein M0D69_36570 [Caballeronia sp. SEWSISQ10-4 2]|nr:hypothetical protein [Caballeronia sp. SEWSISQ10-4 2]MDN7183430.1 hypothetical protein [Caballeronia sp. SEWSISQ10-4 2]